MEWMQVPAGIHLLTAVLLSVWSATVWSGADTVMSLESSRLFNLIMMPLKLFCQVVPEDSCGSLPALRFAENWRANKQRTQAHLASVQLILLFPHALKSTVHMDVFQFICVKSQTKHEKETLLVCRVFFWRGLVHLRIFCSFFLKWIQWHHRPVWLGTTNLL